MNNESQVLNVPIEDIIPNRFQPRLNFDEDGLKELAASIKEHGIIQPLVLRRLGDKYEIIAGERRYKASKIAGLTTVPAIISAMDDKKSAEVAIVENVQRRDLSSIEEAKSYKALLDKGYLTQEELAKKMGLSQSAISNKLRLLSLSELVQNALMQNKISERHARSLLKIESLEEQEKWLDIIINERLTVRELEKRLKEETDDSNNEEIVSMVPNVEEKANEYQDIKVENKYEDIAPAANTEINIESTNKFFNFMEESKVNMNTVEEVDEPEEIELLDFVVNTNNNNNVEEINVLIENLKNEFINKNYKININKSEDSQKLKFVIEIDKNKEN